MDVALWWYKWVDGLARSPDEVYGVNNSHVTPDCHLSDKASCKPATQSQEIRRFWPLALSAPGRSLYCTHFMGWLAAPLCTMNCTHVYCIYVNIYTCTMYPVIYGSLLALHIAIVHMCIISVVNVGWWLPGRSTTKWQWTRLWLVIASGIRTLHWSKIYIIQGSQVFMTKSDLCPKPSPCWLVDY